MSGDLLALADALDRLADEATPGPWAPYFSVHGDPFVVPAENPLLSRRLADVAVSPDDYGRANAHLLAQAPALARALAATLRAVAGAHYADWSGHCAGDHGDCHEQSPCEQVSRAVAAVEPLLPLLAPTPPAPVTQEGEQ